MAGGTYKIEGGEEIQRRLKELPAKLSKGIVRKALRAGAKVVLFAAKENAPVKTGQLKRSLKVRVGKRKKNRISFLVQTRQGDYAGDEFYGAFQEFGWKHGRRKSQAKNAAATDTRKRIPGKHFIERAYKETDVTAVKVITETMRAGLDAEVKQ